MNPAQVKRIESLQANLGLLREKVVGEIAKVNGDNPTEAFNAQIDFDDALFGIHYTEKALLRLLDRAEYERKKTLGVEPDAKKKTKAKNR